MEIRTLSQQFGVNAETGENGNFPRFLRSVQGKRVLVLTDENTLPISETICSALERNGSKVIAFSYPEPEPVADERTVEAARARGEAADYLLAVGAGTLNDVAKRAGFLLGKPSGVFATAPSMDGFASGVTPLIENGFKITRNAQVARDILIDYSVLCAAPRIMLGAGVGDILAKYCCLTDWRVSSFLTGEPYKREAADLMYEAVRACDAAVPALVRGEREGVEKLMEALLISGYSMVIAGNSRPASGAEHHMSHFLEMEFLRRGERIPLHGIKVGLGTAVSLWLYRHLKDFPAFEGSERVLNEAEKLPESEYVLNILGELGCPVRFSQLGVSRETVRRMLFEAYKIRDRFTILTLYCTRGFMARAADEILDRFY